MIRVGFIGAVSKEWMGGLNYYKNLLYAISTLEEKKIKVFVFVGKKTDNEIKNMFKKYATVIEHGMFDSKSLKWYVWKILYKKFGFIYFLDLVLKKYNIQVLSHANVVGLSSCKTVNWIPDFQYIHLPDMFSKREIKSRNNDYLTTIKGSDKIVLSSYSALKDFNTVAREYSQKVDILQFVSQPDDRYFSLENYDKNILIKKYNLWDSFYYIPNQFWKHKNHMFVFEAIKALKDRQVKVNIVCTGYMNDYRNKEYINTLKHFISINKLDDRIKLLGLVDYEDVFALMKFSKAVINPSLFEGWSSTVEECKSVGKNMILSDLDVHREQYPKSVFFDRNSYESLAMVLEKYNFNDQIIVPNLHERTEAFAGKYINILTEVLNEK